MKGNADCILEDISGCGIYQALMYIFIFVFGRMSVVYTIVSMSFGSYNPGWRCLDNQTQIATDSQIFASQENQTITTTESQRLAATRNQKFAATDNRSEGYYTHGDCEVYKRCSNVEFNPESSTVVTEWGLICDDAWMSSFIISMQMVGMIVGSYLGGQISDSFGRKITFYGFAAVCGMLQLGSAFSVSWSMFVVLKFFIGASASCVISLTYVYVVETMTMKWRGPMLMIPFSYLGAIVYGFFAIILKDWRKVDLVGCAIWGLTFIPVIWTPESLRWLDAKGKREKFMTVAEKITKLNKKSLSSFHFHDFDNNLLHLNSDAKDVNIKKYSMLDLFRPGYKRVTFSIFIMHFLFGFTYFALVFGVKSVYGDFYVNLIVLNLIVIPLPLITSIGYRYFKRKTMTTICLVVSGVCALGAVGCLSSDNLIAKTILSTLLISFSRGTLGSAWNSMFSRVMEMYPTVVRTIALGFASLSARVGGILAPFIIPNSKDNFYVLMTIITVSDIICVIISFTLPETKNKTLKETFEEKVNNVNDGSNEQAEVSSS